MPPFIVLGLHMVFAQKQLSTITHESLQTGWTLLLFTSTVLASCVLLLATRALDFASRCTSVPVTQTHSDSRHGLICLKQCKSSQSTCVLCRLILAQKALVAMLC